MNNVNMAAIYLVQTLGSLYLLVVLLRFILQLVRADFYNPLSQFIVRVTQPLLKPLRKVVPGLGGLDLAALVLDAVARCWWTCRSTCARWCRSGSSRCTTARAAWRWPRPC